jgi:hypothetical protein
LRRSNSRYTSDEWDVSGAGDGADDDEDIDDDDYDGLLPELDLAGEADSETEDDDAIPANAPPAPAAAPAAAGPDAWGFLQNFNGPFVKAPFITDGPLSRVAAECRQIVQNGDELAHYLLFRPDADRALEVATINAYVASFTPDVPRPAYVPENRPWPPRWVSTWSALTIDELLLFEGLLIQTGIVSRPSTRDWWRDDWPHFGAFNGLMTRQRFEEIMAALHFVPTRDTPNNAPVTYKIRPFLDRFKARCLYVYHPGEFLAIDEDGVRDESRFQPPGLHLTINGEYK